jgi:hypothetical protein
MNGTEQLGNDGGVDRNCRVDGQDRDARTGKIKPKYSIAT